MYMLFYRGTFAESLERHESQYSQMTSLNHSSPRRNAKALQKGEEIESVFFTHQFWHGAGAECSVEAVLDDGQ